MGSNHGEGMSEVYVSVDVEADGPLPGPNSMLSLGAAAFVIGEKGPINTFSTNLEAISGAVQDPDTMAWWAKPENQTAWAKCRENTVPATQGMKEFTEWVKTLPGKPVCVAYPAGYDFMFLYWYMIRFTKESPFSFSCLDIKTAAAMALKLPYRAATKRNMPRRWFSNSPHTHVAIDDAIEQGELFMAIWRENLGQVSK